MRTGLIAILMLLTGAASAEEIKAPQISIAPVDWEAARAALTDSEAARRLSVTANATGSAPDIFDRLNEATGPVFANIAGSSVPVLLPFDLDAFLRRKADENVDYLAGFGAPKFFLAGPAGYTAAFTTMLQDTKPRDVEIQISGFGLLYDLPARAGGEEKPLAGLQADFPGMRRFYFEGRMRYLFTRYGVLYEVSVECFDGSLRSRRRLSCNDAHGIAARLLKALAIAGGRQQTIPAPSVDLAALRPEAQASSFSYYPPGRLIPGTGLRTQGGDTDYTVYASIHFPLADAPGHAYSQMFINLGDCTAAHGDSRTLRRNGKPFRCVPGKTLSAAEMPSGGQNAYPWRDSFCERRAYFVGQCPSGLGHQGQDIVPVGCARNAADGTGSDQCDRRHHQVVAVTDGMVLRAPGHEGLIVVANAPGTNVLFRYLHMNPKALDADGFFSGRSVRAGEIVGKVSNYNGREAGTSYHLHFDMQVPTKDGWALVNPYMTLVSAYERLIGGRGTELRDENTTASDTNITDLAAVPPEYNAPAKSARKKARKTRASAQTKRHKN